MSGWRHDELKPCKIGTMPMLVRVHAADLKRIAPSRRVRIQYEENGKWERVLVTRADDAVQVGYFFADR